jgi:hypothetical protein
MKYKRIVRRFFTKDSKLKRRKANLSIESIFGIMTITSVIAFILIQLVTNAILSPLGHKLENLNSEKNQLIEENRILEQEIAKSNSIIVIETYSEEKFELSNESDKETVFVSNKSVQAVNVK